MGETLKCKTPSHYDIICSYCAAIISFGLEDTIHSDDTGHLMGEENPYRYLRCPNCRRKCITHKQTGNYMVLEKSVEAVY